MDEDVASVTSFMCGDVPQGQAPPGFGMRPNDDIEITVGRPNEIDLSDHDNLTHQTALRVWHCSNNGDLVHEDVVLPYIKFACLMRFYDM